MEAMTAEAQPCIRRKKGARGKEESELGFAQGVGVEFLSDLGLQWCRGGSIRAAHSDGGRWRAQAPSGDE